MKFVCSDSWKECCCQGFHLLFSYSSFVRIKVEDNSAPLSPKVQSLVKLCVWCGLMSCVRVFVALLLLWWRLMTDREQVGTCSLQRELVTMVQVRKSSPYEDRIQKSRRGPVVLFHVFSSCCAVLCDIMRWRDSQSSDWSLMKTLWLCDVWIF